MVPVVGTLPRRHRHWHRHRQSIARVSVSALVASLPLLYLSLLRPPPAALAGDTAFWFLMSNCVIAAIVATADKDDDDGPCDGRSRSDHHVSCSSGAAVGVGPLAAAASNKEPAVVAIMQGGGGVQEAVAASTVATGSNSMYLVAFAQPFLMIQAEDGGAAKNKHGTDLPNQHMHVSALQRGEQHEPAIEPSTDKSSTAVTVVKPGQGEEDRPTQAPGRALAETPETEPEPRVVPKLVASKSLPDHEEAADDEWQPVALYQSPPDPLVHDKGVGAARDGRLRRSATTDGNKSAVAEESEYWELSDEELNSRVEEFIARFNRQIELEAGV